MSTVSSLSSRAPDVVQLLDLPGAKPPLASTALPPAHSPLLDIKAQIQVCVGEAAMTVGELTNARLGHVLTLDREVDGLVDVLLEGRVIARGQLVAVGDHFGVRLTELPTPLAV